MFLLKYEIVFTNSALANCCRAKEENHERQKKKKKVGNNAHLYKIRHIPPTLTLVNRVKKWFNKLF